jgi:hypothetical protein
VAVSATLNDLALSTGGVAPLEQAEAERIRHACERLLQCTDEIAKSALVVAGSILETVRADQAGTGVARLADCDA